MSSTELQYQTDNQSPRFLPALFLLFVGSGCAALIYEIVWYQMLQLVIGLTTISLGVLLGTFMGGMCIGSILLPRIIPSRFHPLRVYAFLEIGIGAIALGILYGLPYLAKIYTDNFGSGTSGMALRVALAVVCLLPPTILMGATLPAIARWVKSTPEGVSWLGFFYGGNIAGAVFGCLLAGFYLLRIYNTATGTYVAFAINMTVGILAILLSTMAARGDVEEDSPQSKGAQTSSRSLSPIYITIALSGMTALGAEVVWARLLGLVLGGTVYTFAIILAVFLAGLGIGSSVAALAARGSRNPHLLLCSCQLLLILAIGWTAYMIAESLPYWPINPSISQSPWYTFQLDMARVFWAIFPGALLWGASFPLALAAASADGQDAGKLVGGVYAANTVGAIIGALGFSILFVPMMGTQNSQRLLIVLAALSGIVASLPILIRPSSPNSTAYPGDDRSSLSLSGVVMVLLAIVAASFLAWRVKPAPWGIIAYGRNMATYGDSIIPGITEPSKLIRDPTRDNIWCLYEGEGLNGSVVVTQDSGGIRSFHSAGKVQASNDPLDMKLQRMLGHISALAVKEPKSVLVVACGAGVTAGTFLLHPTIERIVICDIEGLVPKYVTPMFNKENYGITDGIVKQNPIKVNGKTVEVVYDDGRHFIRTNKEKFDIISSDPIDPWVKGCAALNTIEYYQMCKDHLNPGGVMSLWIPLYESKLATSKSVIGTFFKVFDKGILWSNDDGGRGYDAVLFGQAEGSHFDVDQLQAELDKNPAVQKSLSDVGFVTAVDLLASFASYAPDMQEWMSDAQINYDKDLRLQYLAGMYFNAHEGTDILTDILRYRKFPETMFTGSPNSINELRRAMGIRD